MMKRYEGGKNDLIHSLTICVLFCHGYGLSVRRSESNYISPAKMDYEVMQIKHYYDSNDGKQDYDLCYTGSFSDDVVGYAEPEKVIELAKEVKNQRVV